MNKRPLEGLRVLDMTAFISGPFNTMLLADLGAEVIKVERPPAGDALRNFAVHVQGTSTYFVGANKGKKSIVLDLKKPEHKQVLLELVKHCDIFTENYRPGTVEKMGISYQDLIKIKPDIIYVSTSGFGQTGPYRERGGIDTAIQAISGFMSMTGPKGGEPTKAGPSIADMIAGLYGCIGTLAAVIHHKNTGEGQYVDVAMLDCMVSMLDNAVTKYFFNGEIPKPNGNYHHSSAPLQPFPTSDGNIMVCCPSDNNFKVLTEALGVPELIQDERFDITAHRFEHVPELEAILTPLFQKMTTDEAAELLEEHGLPYGVVNTIDRMVRDKQIQARELFVKVHDHKAGDFTCVGMPLKFSTIETPREVVTPQLGENNVDVLTNLLGMSSEEVDALYSERR